MNGSQTSRAARLAIVAARVANAAFFLMTATYCLLTYNPFAYQQFIRPHLINWLSDFVAWHHIGFWITLGITALTMVRELPRVRGQIVGWLYLIVWSAVGVALLVSPLLPQVENDGRGLVFALLALLPPIWLAIYDHVATAASFAPAPSAEARLLKGVLIAGGVIWLHQTVAVPWRLGNTGEITLTPAGVLLGILTSGVAHLLIFSIFALMVVAILRTAHAARVGGSGEYWLIVAATAGAVTLVTYNTVFGAISFGGRGAWATAALLGVLAASLWSAVARRCSGDGASRSAVEIWMAPLPGIGSRTASMAALVALAVVGYLAVMRLMLFDWDFLLQKLAFLVIWLAAAGYGYGAVISRSERLEWPSVVAPSVVAVTLFGGCSVMQPRLAGWMGEPRFVPEFVLEGYVAVDPSFRLIQHLMYVDPAADVAFYDYLRAHSTLQQPTPPPTPVDFVKPLEPTAAAKPHIFFFVIDSLRRDYLSPYNKAVTFTPSIQRFANDSVTFERALTRYGGTGLSMPAIWSGGMVLHKQYVTPFAPMNTLEKLLDANGYRKIMSPDHITETIVKRNADDITLDQGVIEMEYDFCRTVAELEATLQKPGMLERPVFAHTRSLNLHIAHFRDKIDRFGDSASAFLPPVAAGVERIDGCFGTFIDYLKRAGLYDNSIIVLTADHGDSLGEALRWGHAHTLYPDVIRIPMFIRLPSALGDKYVAEAETIAFSVDLTPTFYKLLGYDPRDLGRLFGAPLFVPAGTDLSWRRKERYLISSSYGAVYGVVTDNGRKVYIASGITSRESAYDMTEPAAVRIGVTQADRASYRAFIARQVDEIARIYRFEPAH